MGTTSVLHDVMVAGILLYYLLPIIGIVATVFVVRKLTRNGRDQNAIQQQGADDVQDACEGRTSRRGPDPR